MKPSSDSRDHLEHSLAELQESLEEKLVLNSEPACLPDAPLDRLLRLCCQEVSCVTFRSFFQYKPQTSPGLHAHFTQVESSELPDMDTLLQRYVDLKEIKKIGEGTFGEAFKAGKTVLKIVPMEGSTLVRRLKLSSLHVLTVTRIEPLLSCFRSTGSPRRRQKRCSLKLRSLLLYLSYVKKSGKKSGSVINLRIALELSLRPTALVCVGASIPLPSVRLGNTGMQKMLLKMTRLIYSRKHSSMW